MNMDALVKTSLLGAALVLTGCGGSSSSSGPAQVKTGVFLDSAVINIGYRTDTLEGVTNSLGEYQYREGETVTFFIGDLSLPSATAKAEVTPLDLVGTNDTSNPTVVNIIRLLQSLDVDGNPDNGITISDIAKGAATQVDFTLSEGDFESSSAVTNLVGNSGSTTIVLISTGDAIAHFEGVLNENFEINMVGRTATSVITNSLCPIDVTAGWEYSFSQTKITLSGTDGWYTPECTLYERETEVFTPSPDGPALPFNCSTYPICTISDFEYSVTGVDGDERTFTSTYTFDRASLTITYVKELNGNTFTEVITIK